MDLVDLVRIGLRRWYVAVPASIVVVLASLVVRSSVDLEYKSTGSLLLFAPREARVAENRLLAFNSLNVPASVSAQVVSSLETKEKLIAQGASGDYEVGLDPSNPAPLVIAVATGSLEQAKRTVELVLAEVDADLERRQVALGAPPETWITTEIVTPPTKPVAQSGARTRAFIAVLMVGMALVAGLTLLVDLVLDRRSGAPRLRRRAASTEGAGPGTPAPDAGVAAAPPPTGPVTPPPAATPPPVPAPGPAFAPRPPAPAAPPRSAVPPTPRPAPPAAASTPAAPSRSAPPAPRPAPSAPAPPRPAAAGSPPPPAPAPPRPATAAHPPAPGAPATAAPPPPAAPAAAPPPAAAPAPAPGAPQPATADRGDGAIPLRRRHPYLLARHDDDPPGDDGSSSVRKSGTD